MQLKLVTINTAKGDGPYARRMELLAAGLERLAPDLVLLQEALVTEDGDWHTARMLGERLTMQMAYAPARLKERSVEGRLYDCTSGLGTLSRFPITATMALPLPSDPADGERIAQCVELGVDGRRLLIANVHLSHLHDRDDLRRAQLAKVLAHPWWLAHRSARLIGGDLNTPIESVPALFSESAGWDWRDGYTYGDGHEPRATFPSALSPDAGRCIDFIISLAPVAEGQPRFRDAAIVLNEPVDGVHPSDHRGVMTTLSLNEVES